MMVWPLIVLLGWVIGLECVSHRASWQRFFRWLPVPLWCYLMPMILSSVGCLPQDPSIYRALTDWLLPLALTLLLMGIDLSSLTRVSLQALLCATIGAVGVILGAPLGLAWTAPWLPPEAWKGAATLVGSWTGGSLNLLALRGILDTPDSIVASLIVVDTVMAYSWMALLVAASSFQKEINRRLGAVESEVVPIGTRPLQTESRQRMSLVLCVLVSIALSWLASIAATRMPSTPLISSHLGWTIVLVSTAAIGLSFSKTIRSWSAHGSRLGYPCLYLVLAATGAQASLRALWESPVWLSVGLTIIALHGVLLLFVGKFFRIPLGILATASQANIGGVVSAPLVGAVYHPSLAPVGLLLALTGNALGTYLGLLSASLCQTWLSYN